MINAAISVQADSKVEHGWFVHVPNAISILRLGAALPLLVLAYEGNESAFTWLLLASLLSDIADGLIARAFRLSTIFGAKLDSIADQLTSCAAVAGLLAFQLTFMQEHWLALATVVGSYVMSDVAALWRFGRLASLHTYLASNGGLCAGNLHHDAFRLGLSRWMLRMMVAISVTAYCEELVIILRVLPEWRANVRGLWWLMREGAES
jgi:phosphatidylglycerophosphate synthase